MLALLFEGIAYCVSGKTCRSKRRETYDGCPGVTGGLAFLDRR
jgi:hypothetical protein